MLASLVAALIWGGAGFAIGWVLSPDEVQARGEITSLNPGQIVSREGQEIAGFVRAVPDDSTIWVLIETSVGAFPNEMPTDGSGHFETRAIRLGGATDEGVEMVILLVVAPQSADGEFKRYFATEAEKEASGDPGAYAEGLPFLPAGTTVLDSVPVVRG